MQTITAPAGAYIDVQAELGPVRIHFDAVQAYHGQAALAMLALIYQGLRGALPRLQDGDQPVPRQELRVICGHPGPGVRDAIEFVTRAVTRGCYTVDTSLPEARYSAKRDKSYSFQLYRGERCVQAILRDGVLPDEFFALLGDPSPAAQQRHAELRHSIAQSVMQQSSEALFDYR